MAFVFVPFYSIMYIFWLECLYFHGQWPSEHVQLQCGH